MDYALVLQSGHIFASDFPCCRSVASICKDHHEASKLSRRPQHAHESVANGDLVASAVPVIMLLSYAYDVPVNPSPRLSGLPNWTIRDRYDIEAKATANTITPSLQNS